MNIRRRLLLCLWGFLLGAVATNAQQLAGLEYFFDHDPGHGQATKIQTVTQGDNALSIPTDGLTSGSHRLCLRAQDENGVWSTTETHSFYLISTTSANIRRLEYFFDTDPGHGEGRTLVEIREGEQQLALNTDGLQPGAHILFLRTQTDDGRWSATEAHPFYLSKTLGTRPTLVEYFFDTDPGYGQGRQLPAEEGEQQLSLSLDDLGYGAHLLFVRVSDEQGGWSAVEAHPFFICEREGFIAMEYYFDTDPGEGHGTPVTLPLYFRDSDPLVVSAPTEGLQPGEHTVCLRGMDKEGQWSEVTVRPFRIEGEEPPTPEQVGDVAFQYNGRYATLATPTDGAAIHYTTDGTQPTAESPLYGGEAVDVEGLVTIRAIATKEGMTPSEVTQFVVPCYYEGHTAQVAVAGTLAQAFGWCDAQAIEQLPVVGNIDATDMATLRAMAALRHVDLKGVETPAHSLPDNAFTSMSRLLTIELPASLTSAGATLFSSCGQLAAIGWNAGVAVPSVSLQSIDNPNLLLYVDVEAYAAQTGVRNVVANGTASSITLSDGAGNTNFFVLRPFTATQASYAHDYQLQTGYDELCGWETLALPFEVQTIAHETRGELTPFALSTGSRDERPFWLCELTDAGWQESPVIRANTPYIVAMPNNEAYSEVYRLAGRVTFSAANVAVPATEAVEAQSGATHFVPTTLAVDASDEVFALNRDPYADYREGSVFVCNLRPVRPFEAYCTTSQPGPYLLPIRDGMVTGLAMTPERTSDTATDGIYDLTGRKLPGIGHKGIYIVNGKKVLIK